MKIPWTEKRTKESIHNELGKKLTLKSKIRKQQANIFGHTMRRQGLENLITTARVLGKRSQGPRGNSLIFFRTPPLKSQKNHILKSQNHKKITSRKHQKSQITEKLLKNQTKKSLEITKITKKLQKKIM